jgi:hypothetical protein
MRLQISLAVAFAAVAGLVLAAERATDRTPSAVPAKDDDYFAEYSADCGMRLLKLARSEAGPFELAFPIGEQRPDERLRPHAWSAGRFVLRGRLTGKKHIVSDCGSWPEFEVIGFRPWGKVRRCVSPGSADPLMLVYTGELPEDRYAPEDFLDGPWPPLLDDDSCHPAAACAQGERRVKACTGKTWCCRLLATEAGEPKP